MRTLILAPFDPFQLDLLRAAATVEYESWLDTRRLADPEELADRIRKRRISILVVEADFVFEGNSGRRARTPIRWNMPRVHQPG